MHGRLAKMDRRNPGASHRRGTGAGSGLPSDAGAKSASSLKGMQQRIGLAQAILHDPDLVILDEPTSALDPLGRRRVREVVQYLKERGKTVFLNSHLLSEVERSCDQVAIINKGRVVVQGALDELLVNRSVVRIELKRVEPRVLEAAAKVAQKIHPHRRAVLHRRSRKRGTISPHWRTR
jgi:ABC-2 type transport system ATP-binding protein